MYLKFWNRKGKVNSFTKLHQEEIKHWNELSVGENNVSGEYLASRKLTNSTRIYVIM